MGTALYLLKQTAKKVARDLKANFRKVSADNVRSFVSNYTGRNFDDLDDGEKFELYRDWIRECDYNANLDYEWYENTSDNVNEILYESTAYDILQSAEDYSTCDDFVRVSCYNFRSSSDFDDVYSDIHDQDGFDEFVRNELHRDGCLDAYDVNRYFDQLVELVDAYYVQMS